MTTTLNRPADDRPTSRTASTVRTWQAKPGWHQVLWAVFAVSAVLGSVGLVWRFVGGHLPAGYGSYVPWGLWVAIYFHGVGIAAGAFAVSALGHLLRLPGFVSPRSLRVAAVLVAASVLPALLAVGLDLGQMTRAWRIFVTPSFTSMMAFNSWAYVVLLAICATVWWLSYRADRGWLKPVLVLGVVISVMVPSQSGAFFGVVDAKPYWHSALLPILLLVSAVTAGAATLLLVRAVLAAGQPDSSAERREASAAVGVLRRVVLAGIGVYFVLEFAEFSVAWWNPQATAPELSLVLTGPYWWVFWGVHVALGGVLAAALLAARRPPWWPVAAAVVAVAFLSTRLNVLVPGQAVGELDGLQAAYAHPRLDYVYHATVMEYLVALFCLALGMAICYVGLRVSAALESSIPTIPRFPRISRKDHTDAVS
ncbi:molybdopterin-containing oxidoreductase family membrane subunit [Micromonospora sp. Llam0]|uniref:NrfD/PsrC family molybdoenzyme membrane anchor subunit n=1 Tax=Micromonospora sp. Llam0 TaxID=2485143 RepID=UPI000F48F363|nr:NrfD/PsrC family molybdoenzyme membrane anchor subunit [Micromonospora sp. Llam0]ROO52196.1 molybdopterin-containing oxidoreductase family membrane subunit [Micromonospora sp. Llam0]